jgi:ABC-type uncharacterized transport system substrate-binding protein
MTRGILVIALALSISYGLILLDPPCARAAQQTQRVVRLGFVAPYSDDYTAFWKRLRELGWIEGENLIVETRRAEGHIEKFPALMADVVGRRVDVIVTVGTPAAVAARNATSTTPIVDAGMGDPVGSGLVASLGRPGGNLTGLSVEMTEEMSGKWLELLQETVPRLATVAVIWNPDDLLNARLRKALEAAAQMRHVELRLESSSGHPDSSVRPAALAEPDMESCSIRLPVGVIHGRWDRGCGRSGGVAVEEPPPGGSGPRPRCGVDCVDSAIGTKAVPLDTHTALGSGYCH